jgi:hypothetical protein
MVTMYDLGHDGGGKHQQAVGAHAHARRAKNLHTMPEHIPRDAHGDRQRRHADNLAHRTTGEGQAGGEKQEADDAPVHPGAGGHLLDGFEHFAGHGHGNDRNISRRAVS